MVTLERLDEVRKTVEENLEARRNAEGPEERRNRMEQGIPLREEFASYQIETEDLVTISVREMVSKGLDPHAWTSGVLYGLTLAKSLETTKELEGLYNDSPSS